MTRLKDNFSSQAAGFEAYRTLKAHFANWQAAQDQVDLLTARNWLGLEGDEAALTDATIRLRTMLNDPALGLSGLLGQAEAVEAALPTLDLANLRQMRAAYESNRGFDADSTRSFIALTSGDAVARFAAAREKLTELEARQQRYDLTVKATGNAPTRRQENRQNTYREKIRSARADYMTDVEAIMVPIFEAKRALLADAAPGHGTSRAELSLQAWNPGVTARDFEATLAGVKAGYPELYRQTRDVKPQPPLPLPPVPVADQRRVLLAVRSALRAAAGWDDARVAAAGIVEHYHVNHRGSGMCWGSSNEFYEEISTERTNLIEGLVTQSHESGHMLYLFGLRDMDPVYRDQPVGQINGYGTHEVSAVTFEMLAAKPEFWTFVAPVVKETLGLDGPEWSPDNLARLAVQTYSSWSYSIDTIPDAASSWRIMQALLDGESSVRDAFRRAPSIWAETRAAYTGEPHDPADFSFDYDHWVTGMEGYFTYCYLHGAIGAETVHDVAENKAATRPGPASLTDLIAPYLETMRDGIYQRGRAVDPVRMIGELAGGRMTAAPLLRRLTGSEMADPPQVTLLPGSASRPAPGPATFS